MIEILCETLHTNTVKRRKKYKRAHHICLFKTMEKSLLIHIYVHVHAFIVYKFELYIHLKH